MADLEPPEFLIRDILHTGTAAAMVSAPNVGKTFIALDMAFSVAAGVRWHGLDTKQAPVIYIIAEGKGGMAKRVKAWRQTHDIPLGVPVGVWFWDRDVQLASWPNRQAFKAEVDKVANEANRQPGLIIVDTLARCFVGLDENAAQDMGRFVEGIDMLRSAGAAVLVLHHEGHLRGRERGSTALRGAVDTMLHLSPSELDSGVLVLSCMKQRESDPFDTLYLQLHTVDLPGGRTSCVLVDAPPLSVPVSAKWETAIVVLKKHKDGLETKSWQDEARRLGMSERTFFRMRKESLLRGRVAQRGERYYYVEKKEQPKDESTNSEG